MRKIIEPTLLSDCKSKLKILQIPKVLKCAGLPYRGVLWTLLKAPPGSPRTLRAA